MLLAVVRRETLFGGLVLFCNSHFFFLLKTEFAGGEVKALFFRRRKTHCREISCVSRETENTNPRAKGEIKVKLQEIKRNKGQDAIKETNMKEYASLYRSRKTFLSSYITLTHLVERGEH